VYVGPQPTYFTTIVRAYFKEKARQINRLDLNEVAKTIYSESGLKHTKGLFDCTYNVGIEITGTHCSYPAEKFLVTAVFFFLSQNDFEQKI